MCNAVSWGVAPKQENTDKKIIKKDLEGEVIKLTFCENIYIDTKK